MLTVASGGGTEGVFVTAIFSLSIDAGGCYRLAMQLFLYDLG